MGDPAESSTFIIGRRSAAAILAALGLLRDHAHDGYESPHILEVGEQFSDCEPMTDRELADLVDEIANAFD